MVDPAHLADQKMKMPDFVNASPLEDGFCEKEGGGGEDRGDRGQEKIG